ncbi:hypothetical protein WJX81_006506 [Elliptochloris bilobata]|uniref:Heterogeneous nuclear ribonucleoprotein Q acidic domain-containing protein n=1 Tax=Elliptochloris bilobata TaxID=381761 RepID=A0AAW1RR48_9CHLO
MAPAESVSPRGRSRSMSKEPAKASVSRSRSRSRSPRDKSASPRRRVLSRSASPRGRLSRSRSRSRAAAGDWKRKLDDLIDRGTIRSSDLDNRTMDALEDLTDDQADQAVERFCEANFARISNKSGFLMGIIRRVQEDGPGGGNVDLDILPRSVRYRLRDLLDDGRLKKDDIDSRMLKSLADLPSDLGLEAVEKFGMASLETVRSKTGFMMGIIKRIEMDRRGMPYGGPPPAYGRGPPMDRYYDRGGYGGLYDRYGGGGDRFGGDRYGGDRYGDRYGGGGGDRFGGGGGYDRYRRY